MYKLTEAEQKDYDAFLEKFIGIHASIVARNMGKMTPGINWTKCSKGHLAEAYARRNDGSYGSRNLNIDLNKLRTLVEQDIATREGRLKDKRDMTDRITEQQAQAHMRRVKAGSRSEVEKLQDTIRELVLTDALPPRDELLQILGDCHNTISNLRKEMDRLQALPEMEWAKVTSIIMQVLASCARAGYNVKETEAVKALDAGSTYINRRMAYFDKALALLTRARNSTLPHAMRYEIEYFLDNEHGSDKKQTNQSM